MLQALKLFVIFFKIGVIGFGGGYGMLPLIQKEIVGGGYLTKKEFWDIVAIAGTTPGPIAVNVATFVGYRVAGVFGAAISTFGVVLPAFVVILLVAMGLWKYFDAKEMRWILTGIKSAIIGFMVFAALSLFRAIGASKPMVLTLAVISFTSLLFGANPFLIILIFMGAGFALGRFGLL